MVDNDIFLRVLFSHPNECKFTCRDFHQLVKPISSVLCRMVYYSIVEVWKLITSLVSVDGPLCPPYPDCLPHMSLSFVALFIHYLHALPVCDIIQCSSISCHDFRFMAGDLSSWVSSEGFITHMQLEYRCSVRKSLCQNINKNHEMRYQSSLMWIWLSVFWTVYLKEHHL